MKLITTENVLYLSLISYVVSLCFLLIYLFKTERHKKRWILSFFFLSVFLFNFSYRISEDIHSIDLLYSVFDTAISTFQTFTIDLNYQKVASDFITVVQGNFCWKLYAGLLMLEAPLASGFTIITSIASLFPELKSSLKFQLRTALKNNMLVFSALNEQSLHLASELKEAYRYKNPLILFGNCTSDANDSEYDVLLNRAVEQGFLCMKKDLASIHFKKHHNVTYYFVSEDDMVNFDDAAYMADEDKGASCWNKCSCNTEFIVFSQKDIVKNILEEIISLKRQPRVTIVPYITNTIYYQLFYHPLFLDKKRGETLTVSIIGENDWTIEIFKTILWYGQIDGVSLKVNCYVKDEVCYREKLNYLIPEFKKFKPAFDDDLPNCSLNVEPFSESRITVCGKSDAWFVCTDSEQVNIETAYYIAQVSGEPVDIFYQIRSNNIYNALEHSDKKAGTYGCRMHAFGSMYEQYSLNNIEGCLYKFACGLDNAWQNTAAKNTFEEEYKRRSSLASALHLTYKLYHFNLLSKNKLLHFSDPSLNPGDVILDSLKNRWTENFQASCRHAIGRIEHRRWFAYMCSNGYSGQSLPALPASGPGSEGPIDTKDHFHKKHIALVAYSELSKISEELQKHNTPRDLQEETDYCIMGLVEHLHKEKELLEKEPEVAAPEKEAALEFGRAEHSEHDAYERE